MQNNPLVSIIIPVYNAEHFIRRCIQSLINQSYKNIEILIVDDGSLDKSGLICAEYVNIQHPYLTVIHHEKNQGVSKARITGVENAHGEYVMFVDVDDTVAPQILDVMVDASLSENADMVSCGALYRSDNEIYPEKRTITGVFNREGIRQLLISHLLYDVTIGRSGMPLYLWGKLFKREMLWESLQKGKGYRYGEDIVINLDLLINKVNRLVCLEDSLYEYYHHPDQVTSSGLIRLWPDYEQLWCYIESLGIEGMDKQLQLRMWTYIKPSIYDSRETWGGRKQYVSIFKNVRNSDIVKRFIFNKKQLPREIKKHPHYYFLKCRLYSLDYLFYCILWAKKK